MHPYVRYAIVPSVCALIAFVYECRSRIRSGNSIFSVVLGSGKSAVGTFVVALIIVYCEERSMTPV